MSDDDDFITPLPLGNDGCSAAVKIVRDKRSLEVSVFDEGDHDHCRKDKQGETDNSYTRITEEQRAVILDCEHRGITKPKAINWQLRDRELPEIKTGTLSAFLKRKREKDNPVLKTYYELEDWCKKNFRFSPAIFLNFPLDEPFVAAYEVNEHTKPLVARVVITTRRLIQLGDGAEHICADATHNLNWNKFPTLLMGTTDRDRKFHLLGLVI